MAEYPDLLAGQKLTATLLGAIVPNIVVKQTATDRASTTVLASDPELSGIALGVGTWSIEVLLFFATITTSTQKIKTQWAFTGTWNTPTRACIGPGSTNTASRADVTPSQFNGALSTTDVVYGAQASAGFTVAREVSHLVVVSVAGDMALSWAQSAASANTTSLKPGSTVIARQIA